MSAATNTKQKSTKKESSKKGSSGIVSFESDDEDNVPGSLTKAEYQVKKKEDNKAWKENLKSMRASTVDDEGE